MTYDIASKDLMFSGEGVTSFFHIINSTCEEFHTDYFVIGAFARDILLEHVYKGTAGLATRDVDIAIRLDSWKHYDQISQKLIDTYHFKRGENSHQFISPNGLEADILPFGNIEDGRSIRFSSQSSKEINMLGFQEVQDSLLSISIDGEVEFNIVDLEGMVMLKLIAWDDQEPNSISEKHTRDISIIIRQYYWIKIREFAVEFGDLLDVEDFDEVTCGARALGRRMKQIANDSPELIHYILKIKEEIFSSLENSLFINQYTVASKVEYGYAKGIIENLFWGFSEQ